MASVLEVDELKGVATTGDITITSEGGSATMQLQQGVAKAWNFFDGTASTVSNADSFNVSTLTDVAGGRFKYSFTNNMSTANFSFSGQNTPAENNIGLVSGTNTDGADARTTSSSGKFWTSNAASINNAADGYAVSTGILGDLA